jgi:hypothetical protein
VEHVDRCREGRLIDLSQHIARDFLAESIDVLREIPTRERQMEAVDAAVILIGSPFDQPLLRQLVDEAGEGDRPHFHLARELGLSGPFIAPKLGQGAQLRAGKAKPLGSPVDEMAQMPRRLDERA